MMLRCLGKILMPQTTKYLTACKMSCVHFFGNPNNQLIPMAMIHSRSDISAFVYIAWSLIRKLLTRFSLILSKNLG